MKKSERGFALLASLWALVFVGAVAGAYLAESSHVARITRNRNAELQARQAAQAGLERAHNALERLQILRFDPAITLNVESGPRLTRVWNDLEAALAEISRDCLGDACYELEIRDLGTTLNVNTASEAQLRNLFLAVGADYRRADVAAQSIADWTDGDDLHRARGAERSYYLAIPIPYEPRNGPITDLSELTRVRGIDRWLSDAAFPFLTVEGSGRININAAPEPVLAALPGLGTQAIQVILDARRRGVVFSNVFELSLHLGATARAQLREGFRELLSLAVLEPVEIEVTSTGLYSPLRVPIRAIYVREGERVTQLKRSRLDI